MKFHNVIHTIYCKGPDYCACDIGWGGKNCTECVRVPGCQHGSCNKPFECNCDVGWIGAECERRKLHSRLDNCVGNESLETLYWLKWGFFCLYFEKKVTRIQNVITQFGIFLTFLTINIASDLNNKSSFQSV